ncbi:hypothetical protein [Acinetobacter rudis]|uniref:hypothetical protein n=1 Tax=Acinetobacter rudis TaxID=632955 RepID=UPI003341C4CA
MFKPYERINSAKEIMKNCSDCEATSRNVIHQSYYAIFNQLVHEVDNRLFYLVDEDVKRKSVHKAYIDGCTNKLFDFQKNSSNYGSLSNFVNITRRLRGLRRRADYEIGSEVRRAEAELSILQAEQAILALESLD